jgi:hypothetical protein
LGLEPFGKIRRVELGTRLLDRLLKKPVVPRCAAGSVHSTIFEGLCVGTGVEVLDERIEQVAT